MCTKSTLALDTGTQVLDNTRLFLCSSNLSFWITQALFKDGKYHIFGQYRYTRNVPVFTNTPDVPVSGTLSKTFSDHFLPSTFSHHKGVSVDLGLKIFSQETLVIYHVIQV